MIRQPTSELKTFLTTWAGDSSERQTLAGVINSLCEGARKLARVIRSGAEATNNVATATNADGDTQKPLDVYANGLFRAALETTGVRVFASEEEETAAELNPQGTLALAIDPLDGSSNIETNISIVTIFSLMPVNPQAPLESFFQAGTKQLAAGFFVYGPKIELVLTLGEGTHVFLLDEASGAFVIRALNIVIPEKTSEFAINMSNYRHWEPPIRAYIDECLEGADGARGRNFNMRWVASLVADTGRILSRGGVFLYPADRRKGYSQGRLRLIYEVAPVALIIEQARGKAIGGAGRILDLVPRTLHERVPFLFGSANEMSYLEHCLQRTEDALATSPLFGKRTLFRTGKGQ